MSRMFLTEFHVSDICSCEVISTFTTEYCFPLPMNEKIRVCLLYIFCCEI